MKAVKRLALGMLSISPLAGARDLQGSPWTGYFNHSKGDQQSLIPSHCVLRGRDVHCRFNPRPKVRPEVHRTGGQSSHGGNHYEHT
jgi:hypothetical protein